MAATPKTLQIKVTLKGIRPPIWRRLVVSGSATLDGLHRVIQVAMGWGNYDLHCFRIGGVRYGLADDEDFDLLGIPTRSRGLESLQVAVDVVADRVQPCSSDAPFIVREEDLKLRTEHKHFYGEIKSAQGIKRGESF